MPFLSALPSKQSLFDRSLLVLCSLLVCHYPERVADR